MCSKVGVDLYTSSDVQIPVFPWSYALGAALNSSERTCRLGGVCAVGLVGFDAPEIRKQG